MNYKGGRLKKILNLDSDPDETSCQLGFKLYFKQFMKKSYKKGFKIIAKNKTFSVPMSRYLRKLFEDNFPNNKMSSR